MSADYYRPPPGAEDIVSMRPVELRQSRTRSPEQNAAQRFRLIPFDEIRIDPAPNYLVKGLIPRHGLVVIWGPPKCGKSFTVFDMMMHVALGWMYRGLRVNQGTVVYCVLEGADGFKARAEAFRMQHLAGHQEPVPFRIMATPLNLVADHKALIAAIRDQLCEEQPVAIVLDTLNRSFTGSESDDEAMTAYVKAADALRDAFRCVVPIVHHCGIEGTRPRGHTSLTGAADAQLAVKKDGSALITMTVEYMKDGPEGAVIASRLERVEVGRDTDGDPITSCIVVPVDESEVKHAEPKRPLSPKQKRALGALTETLLSYGKPSPTAFGLPVGIKAVEIERWKEELFHSGVIEKDDKNPRTTFGRLKEALLERGLVGERDGLIWSAQ
jgi:hypothetical protein